MKVYRIENDKGEGPYNAIPRWEWQAANIDTRASALSNIDPRTGKSRQPMSSQHAAYYFGGMDGTGKRFGFPSLSALRRWFWSRERRFLAEQGMQVQVYEVPSDAVSVENDGAQVIFDKSRALRLDRRSL